MRGIHHQVANFKRLKNLICGKDPIPFEVKSAKVLVISLIYHTLKLLKISPPLYLCCSRICGFLSPIHNVSIVGFAINKTAIQG